MSNSNTWWGTSAPFCLPPPRKVTAANPTVQHNITMSGA